MHARMKVYLSGTPKIGASVPQLEAGETAVVDCFCVLGTIHISRVQDMQKGKMLARFSTLPTQLQSKYLWWLLVLGKLVLGSRQQAADRQGDKGAKVTKTASGDAAANAV